MSMPTSTDATEASDGVEGIGAVLGAAWGDAVERVAATWLAGVIPTAVMLLYVTVGTVCAMVIVGASSAAVGTLFGAAVGLPIAAAIGLLIAAMYVLLASVFLAPPTQAMFRAHWRHLQDGQPLGVMDGVRGGTRSWSVNVALVAILTLQTVGYLLLFLPGVLVDAALGFVVPAMVIHELPLHRAVGRSLAHFLRAPVWHIGLSLVDGLVAAALNGLVPVLGGLVSIPLTLQLDLRAYLDAYPADADGTEPPVDADEPVST